MTALGRAGLAVALLPLGLLLSASCNRNSSKPDTGIIVEITDAQTPVVAMDGAVDIATDGPSDFAPDAAGGKDTFSATGGAGSTDASSGTGGAIGTDGGTLAVDVRTVMGDGLDVDTPPDVPFGGIGGTGGATAMGGMTGTGGAASTGGAGTGGAPTNGGTTTTGATITNGGATSTGGSATTGGTTASGGAGGGGGTSVGGGTPPSCIGLPATCGPSGNEDCCMSLLVPGGAFFRGYDGVVSTDKSYPATVSDFYLDKYEITVGRFRQFANAGMGTQASPPAAGAGVHPLIAASGWDSGWNANLPADTVALKAAVKCEPTFQTWTDTAGGNEVRPQNCLNWYTAFAFCAWDGGRLATESEWHYAASGGDEQREYPWGSGIDTGKASYWVDSTQQCMGDGVAGCSLEDIIVVGSKPAGNGKWGHADLAGNVWEWTLDWFATYQSPCSNCANLAVADSRVFRGGRFYGGASYLRATYRGSSAPEIRSVYVGSRCARSSL